MSTPIEVKVIKYTEIKYPIQNRTPYLGEPLQMSFSLPDDHFLNLLGKHYKCEVSISKTENEKADNSPRRQKIDDGILLEKVKPIKSIFGLIILDISELECNFSQNDSVFLQCLTSQRKGTGTVVFMDGNQMEIETYFSPVNGGYIEVKKHFSAFNDWKDTTIDNYYRILRAPKKLEILEGKLNDTVENCEFHIEPVTSKGPLDSYQLEVFNQCLSNSPVNLVQGPPGTGKTTFAGYLATHLVSEGYQVMVTAFTHEAVNNILEKILEVGGQVKKIGRARRSSENLKHFTSARFNSSKEDNFIIGMTVYELLKNHRKFDFILVDEASQMDLVSGMHFLTSSAKTIFIGDHMQLPNIPKIPDTEFSISIFDLLRKVYKPTPLLTTYRFNQRICDYISPNFYEGKLNCSDFAKSRYLEITSGLDFSLLKVLTKEIFEEALVFINTEEEVEFFINKEQANLIADLVEDFLALGMPKNEIGIIAPNNMQLNFIKKVLSARKVDWMGIQIETVNKFQGQQKEVILYSSVITKMDSEKAKYDFFFDIRRFNVAVSRAKKMAIVLGNRDLIAKAGNLLPYGEKIADYINRSTELNLSRVN